MRKSSPHLATEQADGARPWRKRLWRKTSYVVTLALVLVVIAGVVIGGWHAVNSYAASNSVNCTPNAILVNPCRPWLGAAAGRNPGTPAFHLSQDPISQANYLDSLVGRNLDIFRFFHQPTGNNDLGDLPLDPSVGDGKAEIHFSESSSTYVDVNWKPANTWAEADGSNATINAAIAQAAKNIAAVAPHKIFLTVWHEPQDDVSAFDNSTEQTACQSDPNFKGLSPQTQAGTPDQYQAMWHNVQTIFKQQGVTNVVWAMNYMSYTPLNCLIPDLWPGNQSIDWVLYDSYARINNQTFADTAGAFYKVLQKDSSPSVNFDSKPWGLGEFNDCNPPVPQDAITYFNDARTAFQANTYPNLKMYMVFAEVGIHGRQGCLTDYNNQGQLWPAKQAAFNQLAKAVLNK
jgi:hypothetical protein